ncbi:spore germination lipoprotein GerD [Litchfieldia salsa]|uniref:Spore germination protein D n=1 Tax=Litchfieldia salsa TaxID=930152 RepID=A0A1H0WTZ1_9BACI|nr:spore germination lipoprotein GerD [Litchfieldia salsa]SDP94201.1 spore germination protein D [Litchfieldia salsa]
MKQFKVLLLITPFLLIIGCAPAEQGSNQMDYDQTKKMVVDILKTDEGKSAIEEILADESMKQKLIMDQAIVSKSIQTTLTSDEAIAFWKKTFEDPKFVETFAKSMQAEHEKMIKGLMKDPEYQAMMIDIMKDPELEKRLLETLKSQEYRGYLQTVMSETFESPLYKAKIQDILIKAAEEQQALNSAEKKEEE